MTYTFVGGPHDGKQWDSKYRIPEVKFPRDGGGWHVYVADGDKLVYQEEK